MASTRLFTPLVYRRLASIPALPTPAKLGVSEFEEPRDVRARRMNGVLMRIFNDTELHAAVRSRGQEVVFAEYGDDKSSLPDTFQGYLSLTLDPKHRMVLRHQELAFMAEVGNDMVSVHHPLYDCDGKLYYLEDRGPRRAVLAAHDILGYTFNQGYDRKLAPSPRRVLSSLDDAIKRLIK